jgi:ankyrin repeat protein
MLLARGADTSARNDAGATPRDEADRRGHARTARQLSSAAQVGSPAPQASTARVDDAALAQAPTAPPGEGATAPAETSPTGGTR